MAVSSKWGRHSTAREVAEGRDLRGKTVIVTGGAGGIGVETVRALRDAGADVTVTARDTGRAMAILRDNGVMDGPVEALDLANLASVRDFAARWGDRPLDILINNAGIMETTPGVTADGFERHIGVNHLGHFLLANLLTPALRKGKNSRVVVVSSSAHRLAPWDAQDPYFRTKPFDPHAAYGQSKAANALFALGYDQRHADEGIRAFALMPGVIKTFLLGNVDDPAMIPFFERMQHALKTPQQGASTSVWAAIGHDLDGKGGLYLENCREAEPAHPDVMGVGVAAHVRDPANADRLWQWSLAETGLQQAK
jgi:NAD(P)-dependent dehydrogenase (short-subunit alcohol dehydrogenase family)